MSNLERYYELHDQVVSAFNEATNLDLQALLALDKANLFRAKMELTVSNWAFNKSQFEFYDQKRRDLERQAKVAWVVYDRLVCEENCVVAEMRV